MRPSRPNWAPPRHGGLLGVYILQAGPARNIYVPNKPPCRGGAQLGHARSGKVGEGVDFLLAKRFGGAGYNELQITLTTLRFTE